MFGVHGSSMLMVVQAISFYINLTAARRKLFIVQLIELKSIKTVEMFSPNFLEKSFKILNFMIKVLRNFLEIKIIQIRDAMILIYPCQSDCTDSITKANPNPTQLSLTNLRFPRDEAFKLHRRNFNKPRACFRLSSTSSDGNSNPIKSHDYCELGHVVAGIA